MALATGALLVFLGLLFTRQARELAAPLAHTLLDQIVPCFGEGRIIPNPWLGFFPLAKATGGGAALAMLRWSQFALYESGAVALCWYAMQRGVRPWHAAVLALLYACQPAVLTKMAYDMLFPGAPFVIFSEIARMRGKRGWSADWLVAAAWSHPVGGVGPLLWTLLRARWSPGPAERRACYQTAAVLAAAMLALWSSLIIPFVVSAQGSQTARMAYGLLPGIAGHGHWAKTAHHLGRNILQTAALLGTTGFLICLRPILLLPLAFDLLYGLPTFASVTDHGLIGSSVGLLFVLTVEAIATNPRPTAGRYLPAALAVAAILTGALHWGTGLPTIWRQAVSPRPPRPHLRELRELGGLAGRRCVVTPTLSPFFCGRCASVVPYADGNGPAELDGRPTTVVLAPLRVLLDWDSYDIQAWERSRTALRRILGWTRSGRLAVLRDDATLIVLANDSGAPARPALLERLKALADVAHTQEAP